MPSRATGGPAVYAQDAPFRDRADGLEFLQGLALWEGQAHVIKLNQLTGLSAFHAVTPAFGMALERAASLGFHPSVVKRHRLDPTPAHQRGHDPPDRTLTQSPGKPGWFQPAPKRKANRRLGIIEHDQGAREARPLNAFSGEPSICTNSRLQVAASGGADECEPGVVWTLPQPIGHHPSTQGFPGRFPVNSTTASHVAKVGPKSLTLPYQRQRCLAKNNLLAEVFHTTPASVIEPALQHWLCHLPNPTTVGFESQAFDLHRVVLLCKLVNEFTHRLPDQ